ncbi:cysteine peptidase, Clan CA, family C19,putative [Leishmania mexicana MHOM/GT/2001/U1103]|uniref:Ubiquitin carboxyl-terminal hydrolase n=1 Tax=Leishmania mexicana (strain MHOM/GT/2001/U1103) TaxID=929439 RepID=E9B5K1_LEIMU|nr:cysteine peptidase, Clan CA, family C19,putative [Leishmania mexicana MHOM/GT/2001/U1103]CBZ30521.1 cysteine peptidase, Clan CA, family C19,putative [Leishmania mexicana MHOM/GT/2001/U1103]
MRSGYVGIYNQGSTCYLNSVIQALYHLPAFRTQIYNLPNVQKDSVALALRDVFAQLEVRNRNTTTTELTKAFGWSAQEAAVQHDVHELMQQLFDSLETTLKETPKKNMIRDMFGGLMIYRSRAIDGAEYLSDRLEDFYDVELVVQNKANIEESLREFSSGERIEGVSVEVVPGADATPHTIERSQHFLDCPKVLLVHPNRVAFDMETYELVTLRNVWSFDFNLSLASYVVDDASLKLDKESQEKWKKLSHRTHLSANYSLRSILTHAGDATIGHYYVYVNFDGEWVRFNDEVVESATEEDVRKSAFGGQSIQSRYRLFDNERASLLIYVNDDVKEELLSETPPPSAIVEVGRSIEEERARKEETHKVSYYLCDKSVVDVFDGVHGASDKLQRHMSVRLSPGQDEMAAIITAAAKELHVAPEQIRIFCRDRHGLSPWCAVESMCNSYDSYYYPPIFVDIAPPLAEEDAASATTAAAAAEPFLAFLRHVESPHDRDIPVTIVRSIPELQARVPHDALVYESRGGPQYLSAITATNQLVCGANLLYTHQRSSNDAVRGYLQHRQLVCTKVYLYDDYTAELTELFEIHIVESTPYTTLQVGLYKMMTESKRGLPLPPSHNHLAFFKGNDRCNYAFAMPMAASLTIQWNTYNHTLRDVWGSVQHEHKIVMTILPMPLEKIDLTVLVTFNGGYNNLPHVYVPLEGGSVTFREVLELMVQQLGTRLRAGAAAGYEQQLAGQARLLRLLRVRRGELVEVVEDLDTPIDLEAREDIVLDKLCPALPGYELVNVLFCRRRSGEYYFGLPTNICVNSCLEEQGDVLLRRIVKKLGYPDQEEAMKKWILCVMNVKSRKTRTASKKEVLADLIKEVGGAPFVFVVDRPQCLLLDGIEEEEHRPESIVIKSTSKTDLSAA